MKYMILVIRSNYFDICAYQCEYSNNTTVYYITSNEIVKEDYYLVCKNNLPSGSFGSLLGMVVVFQGPDQLQLDHNELVQNTDDVKVQEHSQHNLENRGP